MSKLFYSEKYQDIYFNHDNPEGEKQFVFVDANRVSERLQTADTLVIAELGFGYGINHRLTVAAANSVDCSHKLRYYSCDESLPAHTEVPVFIGDVSDFMVHLLSELNPPHSGVDAWYFDGFSPAKNPAMWSAKIFSLAFELTRTGGTFSTYTSAGWVRRNAEAAGFQVEKITGFAGKREMLRGKKN